MKPSIRHLAVLAVLALSSGTAARGDILINNVGLTSPDQTITFSEISLPSSSPVTTQYAGFGVTFSPSLYYDPQPLFFPTPSLGNYYILGNAAIYNSPVSLKFAQDESAMAFALVANGGSATFTALLDGVAIETFTAATILQPGIFYGFTNITFNEVSIQSSTEFFQFDNLQTIRASAVPEPTSLVMLSVFTLSVLGHVALRRRRLRARGNAFYEPAEVKPSD